MRCFGENVGIAFQIKDDLFDYGNEDIGKPTGNDIQEKKITLPLIYTLNHVNASTKRNLIYIGGGSYPVVPADQNALWIFDLNTNSWRDPKPKNIPGSNSYNTNISVMEYDTKNDKLLLFRHSGGDENKHPRGIFIYDPQKNEWSTDLLPLPAWRGQCKNAFYAPDLNVYIFHSAGDSADDGSIWAYRYH